MPTVRSGTQERYVEAPTARFPAQALGESMEIAGERLAETRDRAHAGGERPQAPAVAEREV